MNLITNLLLPLLLAGGVSSGTPAGDENQWADGVPFHVNWDDAIKECRATGKLLFIYNGWKREKV